MGRPIAKKMAEKLGIEYYDRDIVDQAAKKLNLPVSVVDEVEETAKKVKASPFARMMFPLGKGTSNTQDKIFEAQQNIIKFLAEKETCVIVGRCADFTLEEMENAMHIYIYAPYEVRVEHCVKDLNIEVEEARKMIVAIDEARDSYHMQYAGYHPDEKPQEYSGGQQFSWRGRYCGFSGGCSEKKVSTVICQRLQKWRNRV